MILSTPKSHRLCSSKRLIVREGHLRNPPLPVPRAICSVLLLLFLVYALTGCSGCSKSGMRYPGNKSFEASSTEQKETPDNGTNRIADDEKTIVKMQKVNGVFKIPVKINDVEMYFIFDTGAGMISISEVEANFLYRQGKLSKKDILGTSNFIDAKGEISEGTIINLRKVTIGDRTLSDIEATVVNNISAPLLFGQSALEKFGKISIDYNKGEITFEK